MWDTGENRVAHVWPCCRVVWFSPHTKQLCNYYWMYFFFFSRFWLGDIGIQKSWVWLVKVRSQICELAGSIFPNFLFLFQNHQALIKVFCLFRSMILKGLLGSTLFISTFSLFLRLYCLQRNGTKYAR